MTEQILQFTGNVELQAAAAGEEQPAKIHILAYTGGVITLPIGLSVIDLDTLRVPASFPILADHKQDLEHTLGTGSGRVLNGKFYVDGVLARNTYTADVIKLAKAGIQLQASICVVVEHLDLQLIKYGGSVHVNDRTIRADASDVGSAFYVARNSELREVTVCPLGADNKTVVTITAAAQQLEDAEMKIKTEADTAEVDIEAASGELERIERIDLLCEEAGNPKVKVNDKTLTLRAHAIG